MTYRNAIVTGAWLWQYQIISNKLHTIGCNFCSIMNAHDILYQPWKVSSYSMVLQFWCTQLLLPYLFYEYICFVCFMVDQFTFRCHGMYAMIWIFNAIGDNVFITKCHNALSHFNIINYGSRQNQQQNSTQRHPFTNDMFGNWYNLSISNLWT